MSAPTRWEVEQATRELQPSDLIYLQDGPRAGQTLLAPQHTGKVCVGLVPNQVPRLGSELVYAPTGSKTSEGCRVYRLLQPNRADE